MSRREQNWGTVGFVIMGLLLANLISLPTHAIGLTVLGSELTLQLTTAVQFGILLTALVCLGNEMAVRSHPDLPDRSFTFSVTFWILPGILTFSSFLVLASITGWLYRVLYAGLVGLLLYAVLSMQYHSMDRDDKASWPSRLVLQIAVYLTALLFFVIISGSGMRAIISATSVLLVSSLLSLELVRELESHSGRIWLYALLIGLMMSEFKWILNYIKMDARIGGALLLLLFYLLTGLTRSMLQKRLTTRLVLEYGFIILLSVSALVIVGRWL